jgi:cytochrome b subunit of formate dehydrogenase
MKELKERITRLERHQRRLHWMLVSLTILVFLIGMLIYSRAF